MAFVYYKFQKRMLTWRSLDSGQKAHLSRVEMRARVKVLEIYKRYIMKNDLNYAAIGYRVRTARKRKGMTQEELAGKTDLTVPYISNIENNHTKLSLVTIAAIANALDTTVDALMYDNMTVLTSQYDADLKDLVDDCSPKERRVILEMVRQLKKSMREA